MYRFGAIAIVGAVMVVASPASAQVCSPLPVVGGQGTSVEKTVSPPGAGPIVSNNWNTDFAVSSMRSFRSYVGTIVPKSDGQYKVEMALKYNNDSADKVFERTVTLKKGQPFRINASPRLSANPYQVNLFVGGIPAVGSNYVVSASGCN